MSNTHPAALPAQSSLAAISRIEWPTVFLAFVIYAGFMTLTYFWQVLPIPVVVILGGLLIGWHGSLQHEVIHGHPTRFRWFNDAVGWPPLSLWLPYAIYREGHLVHHRDEHLTDPIEDPESSYVTRAVWESMGRCGKMLAEFNMTLLGRLTIGPLIMIASFLAQELAALSKGDSSRIRIWLLHAAGSTIVLIWVLLICAMPLWIYLVGFVYGGAMLSRLRSYAEHRYSDHHDHRTAIVENSPLFGLLFLHNNLHVLHHQRPAVPWYRIPALYRQYRDSLIKLNNGLVYNGYGEVALRFLLKRHDDPRHPMHD